MFLSSWVKSLRGLVVASPRRSGNSKASHRRRSCRLAVDVLEDRVTPTTFTVVNTFAFASGTGSLAWAVSRANADRTGSATIHFSSSLNNKVIQLHSTLELNNTADKQGISIDASNVTIRIRGGGPTSNFSVFKVDAGTKASFKHLAIENGQAVNGGAIFNKGALSLNTCLLNADNAVGMGGGIYNESTGALSVTNSRFTKDGADFGGGIYNDHGNLDLYNSSFSNCNASLYGGAINIYQGAMRVSNCTFINNSAVQGGGGGGAIANYSDSSTYNGPVNVANSTFSANWANNSRGGGIYDMNGTMTVSGCHFTGNSALYGGSVANYQGNLTLNSSTVTGSTATYGGGIYNGGGGTLAVTNNSYIGNNTAVWYGGGIMNDAGTVKISTTYLSYNTAYYGGGIYNHGAANLSNVTCWGCTANGTGGGIWNDRSVFARNSNMYFNSAGSGGAIRNYGGSMTILGSNIDYNSARDAGGGIYSSGYVIMGSSMVSGNTVTSSGGWFSGVGGGIFVDFGGSMDLTTSTISGNRANYGAAIFNAGDLQVGYTTITNNVATSTRSGINGPCGGILNLRTLDVDGCTFGGNTASNIVDAWYAGVAGTSAILWGNSGEAVGYYNGNDLT